MNKPKNELTGKRPSGLNTVLLVLIVLLLAGLLLKDFVLKMMPIPEQSPVDNNVISTGIPILVSTTPIPREVVIITSEAATLVPLEVTATPILGVIPFSDPNNLEQLNPVFGWQPGGSEASDYDLTLNPGALTLIAGPQTNYWSNISSAPLIIYPINGNFEVQVRLIYNPSLDYQVAGLGIRAINNPYTFLRINRVFDSRFGGNVVDSYQLIIDRYQRLGGVAYSDEAVYLKINRRNTLFTLSYSTNGVNWVDLYTNFVMDFPDNVEIFLENYSSANQGILAQFYDFTVTPK